jgi:hypothetical protein
MQGTQRMVCCRRSNWGLYQFDRTRQVTINFANNDWQGARQKSAHREKSCVRLMIEVWF